MIPPLHPRAAERLHLDRAPRGRWVLLPHAWVPVAHEHAEGTVCIRAPFYDMFAHPSSPARSAILPVARALIRDVRTFN